MKTQPTPARTMPNSGSWEAVDTATLEMTTLPLIWACRHHPNPRRGPAVFHPLECRTPPPVPLWLSTVGCTISPCHSGFTVSYWVM